MCSVPASESPIVHAEPRPWRLVFSQILWERLLQGLLDQEAAWGVGPWRWHTTPTFHEALVEGLQIAANGLPGIERPAGDRWFCVRFVRGLTVARFAEVLRECQPRPSQLLIVVAIDPTDRQTWAAALQYRDEILPLEELWVTGASPLRLTRSPEVEPLASELRWSRTLMALGEPALRWLRTASVTQIGAGRLGTLLAWQWASLGVRRLRLCDHDTLYLHNVTEMPGLPEREIGRPKVRVLAEQLQAFRPDLELTLIEQPAQHPHIRPLLEQRTDLLVTAVDDEVPRLVGSELARQTLTPHLDVAALIAWGATPAERRYLADARLLLPGAGCVNCVGGLIEPQDVHRRRFAPPGAIPWQRPRPWYEERAGSLLSLNQQIAGAAAQLWLDLITGRLRTSFWQRIEWRQGEGLQAQGAAVSRGEDCPLCLGRELK